MGDKEFLMIQVTKLKILGMVFLIFMMNYSFAINSCNSNSNFDLIFIPDLALQKALEGQLGVEKAYTCSGLEQLTELQVNAKNIKSLEGLQYATNLTKIVLRHNEISDLSPLGALPKLREINVKGNNISSVAPLKDLPALIQIDLSDNNVTDIEPITEISSLKGLFVSNNPISYENLRNISKLQNLQRLGVGGMQLTDLNQVFNLVYDYEALVMLDISGNEIRDLSLLPNFQTLKFLSAVGNDIVSIGPLARMVSLNTLFLSRNQIKNIEPLANLPNIKTLHLNHNQIESLNSLINSNSLSFIDISFNLVAEPYDFIHESSFGDIKDSYIKANFNCLRPQGINALKNMAKKGVRAIVGQQRGPRFCG